MEARFHNLFQIKFVQLIFTWCLSLGERKRQYQIPDGIGIKSDCNGAANIFFVGQLTAKVIFSQSVYGSVKSAIMIWFELFV